MRWVPFALLATGCQQLFSISPIKGDAAGDGPSLHTCIRADFNDGMIDQTLFDVAQPTGGTVTPVGGGVTVTWPMAIPGSNYGGIEVHNKLDVRGGEVSVDVTNFMGDMAEAQLYVGLDATHHYSISVNLDSVEFYVDDGSTGPDTKVGSMTYTIKPLTLTIAHDLAADTVTYSFTNTGGTYSMQIASAFTLQSATLGFNAGSYGPAVNGGVATFDNFGVKSPFCL